MPGDIDMMKHWMRGLWLVAALISSFGIAAAAASAQGLSGQRLITVHIAGDEFRIPRGYFYPLPTARREPGRSADSCVPARAERGVGTRERGVRCVPGATFVASGDHSRYGCESHDD